MATLKNMLVRFGWLNTGGQSFEGDAAVGAESGSAKSQAESRTIFAFSTEKQKLVFLTLFYSCAMLGAHGLAYLIRFEFRLTSGELFELFRSVLWMLPVQLFLLLALGQFHSFLSYFSLPDLKRIIVATIAGGLVSIGVWYATQGEYAPPRSIILLNFFLDTPALVAGRLLFRLLRERQRTNGETAIESYSRRVLIVGAGDVGANLAKEMKQRRSLNMQPVAFLDDDQKKWHTSIHGVPIIGRPELLIDGKVVADEAVIAMPSASGRRVREVAQLLLKLGIKSEIVPSLEQMVNGEVRVSQIRPVQIEDLLGRECVPLETERIRGLVEGKVVMVTGAGGSIGSELCRQIARYNPAQLLLVEQSEPSLFNIEQEMIETNMATKIEPLVADILDQARMSGIFSKHKPQIVFHAAAHKHVYLMERQPAEAIRNNSTGTRLLAQMACDHAVGVFVMISTDKAVNPTSLMGASKRLAEIHLQATQLLKPATTKLITVRFGNVLGSSGSVIPIFRKQIAAGGPITVTHPDVIRYFMTIPEAAGLVIQASVLGKGGEIFVLDMGQPVKIYDLACQMIALSGLKLEKDIDIKFTGLKPGEKLYEELQQLDERNIKTEHPRIMQFCSAMNASEASARGVTEIEATIYSLSDIDLKTRLKSIIPEYRPYES